MNLHMAALLAKTQWTFGPRVVAPDLARVREPPSSQNSRLFGRCTAVGGKWYDMTADTAAAVLRLCNRMVVLLAGPVVVAYSIARMIENLR